MRKLKIVEGEYYHLFNRGVDKQSIFHDFGDYTRFLFLILYFQSAVKIRHLNRAVKEFSRSLGQHSVLAKTVLAKTNNALVNEKEGNRKVELVSFCIMPNHFHLLIKEAKEKGISSFMQRVLNAYSKYYNTKYGKSGHVFQGPYKAVRVADDLQLMHLSVYIHRNPRELSEWLHNESRYPWSSYQDYIRKNRWDYLLENKVIMDRYVDKSEYESFVKTSLAKLSQEEMASWQPKKG